MNAFRLLPVAPIASLCLLVAPAIGQTIPPTWVAQLDGTAHWNDYATSAVTLPSGDVAVTGTAFWEPQPGLFVPQFFTARYSAQGVELWSQSYGSGFYGGNGAADHIASAPGNKLVVAGARDLGGDWVAVQYDDAGVFQWDAIWDANSWFVSSPADMSIDAAGNSYLCGDIGDPVAGPTTAVVKFSPTGALLWSRLYDGTGLAVHAASSIVTDAAGAVFIAGETTDANGIMVFSVSRLDPANGAPLWIRSHGATSPGSFGFGRKIRIDGAGRLIAAGEVGDGAAGTSGMSFVSYAADGTLLWSADLASPANHAAGIGDLALGPTGDAAAVGYEFDLTTGDVDWLVVRASGGQIAWSRSHGGSAALDDRATSVAIDAQGNVYASGYSMDPDRSFDVRVYSPSGTLAAFARAPAPAQGAGYPRDLALGAAGRIYVVGDLSPFPITGGDAVTVAFDLSAAPPTYYCTAKLNSVGCLPVVASSGMPSATSGSGFVVTGSNVRNVKPGLFIYTDAGRAAVPFAGGTRCVDTPIRRSIPLDSGGTPLPASDCTGVYSIDVNAFAVGGLGGLPGAYLLVPGTVVDGQFWGRDPGFPFPDNATLTGGVEWTVGF